jgi:hypothetical protein
MWKYLPDDIVNIILKMVYKEWILLESIENRKIKLLRHLDLKYIKTMRRTPLPKHVFGPGYWRNEGWLFEPKRRNRVQMERDLLYENRPLKLKNFREEIDWSGE